MKRIDLPPLRPALWPYDMRKLAGFGETRAQHSTYNLSTMKLASLEAIASALAAANVRYLIVGGLAVAAHGHGRVTFDVDLVVQPFDFDAEYDVALVGEILPGLKARFVRIETLIRMKEAAGREKDLEDIRQLKLLQENPGDDA